MLADPLDVAWLVEQLTGSSLVFHKGYEMGHMTFQLGKDVSYLNDVVDQLKYWNSPASRSHWVHDA